MAASIESAGSYVKYFMDYIHVAPFYDYASLDLMREWHPYLPSFYPSADFIETIMTTSMGWTIPGELAPVMGWTMVFYLSTVLTFVFFVLLFRRIWVDVESLQIPIAKIS
jgi:hypothetical protein